MISNQQKIEIAKDAIKMLITKLMAEHGNTPEYWEKVLSTTRLYRNILDPKTGLWGEGVMYLYGEFLREVKYHGKYY